MAGVPDFGQVLESFGRDEDRAHAQHSFVLSGEGEEFSNSIQQTPFLDSRPRPLQSLTAAEREGANGPCSNEMDSQPYQLLQWPNSDVVSRSNAQVNVWTGSYANTGLQTANAPYDSVPQEQFDLGLPQPHLDTIISVNNDATTAWPPDHTSEGLVRWSDANSFAPGNIGDYNSAMYSMADAAFSADPNMWSKTLNNEQPTTYTTHAAVPPASSLFPRSGNSVYQQPSRLYGDSRPSIGTGDGENAFASMVNHIPYLSGKFQVPQVADYGNSILTVPNDTFDDYQMAVAQTSSLPLSSNSPLVRVPQDALNLDALYGDTFNTNQDMSGVPSIAIEHYIPSPTSDTYHDLSLTAPLLSSNPNIGHIASGGPSLSPNLPFRSTVETGRRPDIPSLSSGWHFVNNGDVEISIDRVASNSKSRNSSWAMPNFSDESPGYITTPDTQGRSAIATPSERVGSSSSLGLLTSRDVSVTRDISKKKPDLTFVMFGQEEPSRKRRGSYVDLSDKEPLAQVVKYGNNGQVQAFESTLGNSARKVKGPYNATARGNVACCRETGACDTCRRQKKTCDLHKKTPYEQCTSCKSRTRTYKGIPRLPCFLSHMVDSVFFRKGPSNLSPQHFLNRTIGIVEITSANQQLLALEPPRTLQLTQMSGATLDVYVKQFDVCHGDKVDCHEVDQNGKDCVYKMPPYCLAELPTIRDNIRTYIHRERGRYLNILLADSSSSQPMEGTESITQLTVKTALGYAAKRPTSVVSMALDMWAYCRVIELEWTICGEDTLGLSKVEDPSSPWHKFVPITPMMDVQLDQIVIQDILGPLRQRLLLSLEDLIKQHVPTDWFDCYLTMYLLLNHIEWACTHGNKFSKRYGLGRRYSDMKLAESWFHTSKILLSRFHFWSNGSDPFKVDWNKPEKVKFARLEEHQVRFMQKLQRIVKQKERHFKELKDRHHYEKDLYWTHQLFSPKWDPGLPHIMEETLA